MKSKIYIYGWLSIISLALIGCSDKETIIPVVKKGDFTQSITESGELEAVNSHFFNAPRYGRYWYEMKLIGLLEHGTKVEAGDSVFQFDPAEIKKYIVDRETDLEAQKATLEKSIVQNENRSSELRSALLSEQASFDLKKLELEQSRFESEKTRKIKDLQFKQSELQLQKVKRRIELNEISTKSDLFIQQNRVKRVQDDIKAAYDILPNLTIRTPIPGIFQVARSRMTNNPVKLGEMIYYGFPVGSVPDLRWMKVNTKVNEADFLKIKVGQKVKVRLDALPEVVFMGEISFISKLCHPIEYKSRQKVFNVTVKINESDERLKPGMTVNCEFLCSELSNVHYIPLNCLETDGKRAYIYLDKGLKLEKQEVKAGPANNKFIVIEGNISEGQKLVPISEVNQK